MKQDAPDRAVLRCYENGGNAGIMTAEVWTLLAVYA